MPDASSQSMMRGVKKRRLTSILTLCFILAIVAVFSRTLREPEVAPPEPVAVSTPAQKSMTPVPERSTAEDAPVEKNQNAESVAAAPADSSEATETDYENQVRLILKTAPVPVGPVRGAVIVAETMIGD